jgi:hypothetical protein
VEIKNPTSSSIIEFGSGVDYALSEAAKEIKFVVQTLQDIEVKVELPVIIYCDNVGAIFMAEDATATARTKHVDARYHFV